MAKILFASDELEQIKASILVIPVEELMEDNPNFRKVLEKEVGDFVRIDFYRSHKETYPDIEEEFQEFIDNLADGKNDQFDESFFYYENAPMFNGTEDLDY